MGNAGTCSRMLLARGDVPRRCYGEVDPQRNQSVVPAPAASAAPGACWKCRPQACWVRTCILTRLPVIDQLLLASVSPSVKWGDLSIPACLCKEERRQYTHKISSWCLAYSRGAVKWSSPFWFLFYISYLAQPENCVRSTSVSERKSSFPARHAGQNLPILL